MILNLNRNVVFVVILTSFKCVNSITSTVESLVLSTVLVQISETAKAAIVVTHLLIPQPFLVLSLSHLQLAYSQLFSTTYNRLSKSNK